jgi:hypothetical protein
MSALSQLTDRQAHSGSPPSSKCTKISADLPLFGQLDHASRGAKADVRLRLPAHSGHGPELRHGQLGADTGHRGSNPFAVKSCLTAGDVRNAISALAASTCLLPALIPATYKE